MEMSPLPVPAAPKTRSRAVGIWFWFAWNINAVIAVIVFYFFFEGLNDGSITSFNLALWLCLLAGVGLIVGGSLALRTIGKPRLALVLNLLLAVPGLLVGLFLLVLILSHPRWN